MTNGTPGKMFYGFLPWLPGAHIILPFFRIYQFQELPKVADIS
jgi:hypothetical protein